MTTEPRGWPHHIVKLLELLRMYRPQRCVEVGTFAGATAIPMAKTLREWNAVLTCVDTWTGCPVATKPVMLDECVANIQEHGIASSVRLIIAQSVETARHWPILEPIDFLFLDADHEYESVRDDLAAWWPLLRSGALLCGDDYDGEEWPGCVRAWDELAAQHGLTLQTHLTPNTIPPGKRLVWTFKA